MIIEGSLRGAFGSGRSWPGLRPPFCSRGLDFSYITTPLSVTKGA